MKKINKYQLAFELVPECCWGKNLRSLLNEKQWDVVRRDAYARAGGKCCVCGAPTRRLEAHERWSYDEKNAMQKLVDVVALCRACHEVTHISRTQLIGRGMEAMEHFMRVNGCSQMEFHEALKKTNEEYLRRNRIEDWVTDVSWLKDKFNF